MENFEMADLYLRQRKLESIFELLGAEENDITYSIGWALAHSPGLLRRVVRHLFPGTSTAEASEIKLQEHKRGGGITDIEILGPNIHAINEAKRGWNLPTKEQLMKYAKRLKKSKRTHRVMAAMSECSHEYAEPRLPKHVLGFPVHYLNWTDVDRLARLTRLSKGAHAEKRLLAQLQTYIRKIVNMQKQESNMVYVVSVKRGRPRWSKLSWQEIITDKHRYFHPCGVDGYPKEPPNYIGFRYDGQLQSIHHIDKWKLVDEIHTEIPEIKPGKWSPPLYFLYTLGKPIKPSKVVRSGKIHNSRFRVMLDLLLTSKTILEAKRLTDKRMAKQD
jgi:hypothetical protein